MRSRQVLTEISPLLSIECCNNELLSSLLTLLHDPNNENNNIGALEMLEKTTKYFSKDYIKGFIAMDILALLQSPSSTIRIEACNTLFAMLSVFETEFIEQRFLQVIENLTKDPVSNVVNQFVKHIPRLAQKLSFNQFEKCFFSKYVEYLTSKNRFLKEILDILLLKLN